MVAYCLIDSCVSTFDIERRCYRVCVGQGVCGMLVDVCYAVVYQFAQTVSPWTDALKAHQSEWLSAADRLTVQFVECDVSSMVGSELCVVLLS